MEPEKEIIDEEAIAEEVAGEYILKYFKIFLIITICTVLADIAHIFLGDVEYSIGANMILQLAKFGTYVALLYYIYDQYRTCQKPTWLAVSMGGAALLQILSLVYYCVLDNTIFWNIFPLYDYFWWLNIVSIITYTVVFLAAIINKLFLYRFCFYVLAAQAVADIITLENIWEEVFGDGEYAYLFLSGIITLAWHVALLWMIGDSRKEMQDLMENED